MLGIVLTTSTPATVFVGVTERGLARRSDVVVAGEVVDVTVRPGPHGTRETLATIAVDAALKGEPEATITVRQVGGVDDDGGLWIPGSPRFRAGERQVLFLGRRRGGARRTTLLGMGQFHVTLGPDGELVAERRVREPVVGGSGRRRLSLAELARLVGGAARPVDEPTAVSDGTLRPVAAGFTLMESPAGRWREPDHGAPIVFGIDPRGDRKLGYEISADAVDAALAAWSSVPGADLEIVRGTDVDALPLLCDGVSQIVFGDPFEELGDPRRCSGVLAVGGYCVAGRSEAPIEVNGREFRRITEGNITFNDGFGRCPFWTPANLAEVLTHEIGHTLGIDHSSDRDDEASARLKDATMYYRAHFDGRGATLKPDDMAAARAIYPGTMGGVDDLDADGVPDVQDNCPGDDDELAFANPAQTDLDGDGRGDLCDPCPQGETCELIVASRLRVRTRRAMLVWSGLVDRPIAGDLAGNARLELVTADGVLTSNVVPHQPSAGEGRTAAQTRGTVRLGDDQARIVIRRSRRGRSRIRVRVRPFTLGEPTSALVSANLTLGELHFTTNLICRPHPRRVLDCRS